MKHEYPEQIEEYDRDMIKQNRWEEYIDKGEKVERLNIEPFTITLITQQEMKRYIEQDEESKTN